MTPDHFSRVYAHQEYLTPGEPETLDLLGAALLTGRSQLVMEVASGKGEAACVIASRRGCRVVAVDRHPPFIALAARKVVERGLSGAVQLLRADGGRLPLAGDVFDAAYCIGAPSIVGLEACVRELHRTVRPGGVVVVSDIAWRSKPEQPLGPEWGWIARATEHLSGDDYRQALAQAGLEVERVHVHPREAWNAYHRPMLTVVAEERARGEQAFADEVERGIEVERRGVEAFFDYVTFVARNRLEADGGLSRQVS